MYGPVVTRTDEWIASRAVGSDPRIPERATALKFISTFDGARCAVRVSSRGMIQYIKDFGSELGTVPLLEFEILEDGEVQVL